MAGFRRFLPHFKWIAISRKQITRIRQHYTWLSSSCHWTNHQEIQHDIPSRWGNLDGMLPIINPSTVRDSWFILFNLKNTFLQQRICSNHKLPTSFDDRLSITGLKRFTSLPSLKYMPTSSPTLYRESSSLSSIIHYLYSMQVNNDDFEAPLYLLQSYAGDKECQNFLNSPALALSQCSAISIKP